MDEGARIEMTPQETLMARLRRGLLERVFVDSARDFSALLDARDAAPFDSAWVEANQELEGRAGQLPPDDERAMTAIREIAFREAYRLTESPDLAGEVSDDFGLISLAVLTGADHAWVNALWQEYARGEFPHGDLRPVEGSLADFVAEG